MTKKSRLVISGLPTKTVNIFKAAAELLNLSLDQYFILLMLNSGVSTHDLGEFFPDNETKIEWATLISENIFTSYNI